MNPYLAVFIAGVVSMAIGMLWYSPVMFGRHWMSLSGITPESMEKCKDGMGRTYALGFLAGLLKAGAVYYILKLLLFSSLSKNLEVAFVLWLGFVATTLYSSVIWEKKPAALYLINSGYYLVNIFASVLVYYFLRAI